MVSPGKSRGRSRTLSGATRSLARGRAPLPKSCGQDQAQPLPQHRGSAPNPAGGSRPRAYLNNTNAAPHPATMRSKNTPPPSPQNSSPPKPKNGRAEMPSLPTSTARPTCGKCVEKTKRLNTHGVQIEWTPCKKQIEYPPGGHRHSAKSFRKVGTDLIRRVKGRALNSAVECHLHTVEVIGSNPIAPTILLFISPKQRAARAHISSKRCQIYWELGAEGDAGFSGYKR